MEKGIIKFMIGRILLFLNLTIFLLPITALGQLERAVVVSKTSPGNGSCCVCIYDGSEDSFQKMCEKVLKDNKACQDPLIAEIDDKNTIDNWLTKHENQCSNISFAYRGHGQGLYGVGVFANYALTVFGYKKGTVINMDIGGCSTAQNYEGTREYMEKLMRFLPENVQVNITMSQAYCSTEARNPIIFTARRDKVRVIYPNCNNLHSNICLKYGESARCREEGALRHQVCCPGPPRPSKYRYWGLFGVFPRQSDLGHWEEKDPATNFCQGYREKYTGICIESSPEKLKECLKKVASECKYARGVLVDNKILPEAISMFTVGAPPFENQTLPKQVYRKNWSCYEE